MIWLCFKPYAARLLPNAERLRSVLSVARACEQLDIDFIDYFEYTPMRYFSLRAEAMDDIAATSDSAQYSTQMLSRHIDSYVAARTAVVGEAFLDGI